MFEKSYLVFANKDHTAKEVAAIQRLPFFECILINDKQHCKDLIENSKDLISVYIDTLNPKAKHHAI